ncbi:MAG: hypothetical protein QNJ70_09630 [Xenococcaceae cyanobacterium MO_207.B15]|nr:hypothetical protein [Xenococcaceae cyanobacterium MO_207.B15]MDJ0743740.1 hypothetical protein [Xenococcaceae cyanobacterium MO_167.B27]
MVDFTGKYFQGKTAIDIWRIIRGLCNAYGCHCCRIDIATDDVTYQHIPVDEMVQAINDGNKFYFRTYDHCESEADGKITHAMGSRKSDHYTRIYDHKGQFLRHETEFKGKYAQKIIDIIADIERDWFNNLSTKGSQVKFNEQFPTTMNIRIFITYWG